MDIPVTHQSNFGKKWISSHWKESSLQQQLLTLSQLISLGSSLSMKAQHHKSAT